MTGQDIMDAWEKWKAEKQIPGLVKSTNQSEAWLLAAFLAGIEAAEAPWRDSLVDERRLEQL